MQTGNQAQRIAELERTVEELRRVLLAGQSPQASAGGQRMVSVELTEDIGYVTEGMAACKTLDWDGSDDTDAASDIEVYDWQDNSGLVDGDKARAVFIGGRNRWEFLVAGGGGVIAYLGKTDATINKGASGTVSIWTGNNTSPGDSSDDIDNCENKFADLSTDKWVVVLDGLFNVSGPIIIAGEC